MSGLPPGDPQLVSMIVNHLKTQGLFDQFRRDCLADVDTKPAYLNLRQRVDNFVSNHLSNHTWSPHLNKNQLRNNIRQLVLQSGMLEQGVDRIVAQVVDPKIHHIFRPQVERVVREFLSPGELSTEMLPIMTEAEEMPPDYYVPLPGSSSVPPTPMTSDAMSILDTITTLNEGASAWTNSDKTVDRSSAGFPLEQLHEEEAGEMDMSIEDEKPEGQGEEIEEGPEVELQVVDNAAEQERTYPKEEKSEEDVVLEEGDKSEEQAEESGVARPVEGKDKAGEKLEKSKEEGSSKDGEVQKQHIRQKARERLKEEYSLEDSDLEGLSDITVSSVHTSDLSSFEEESDDEPQPSDSTEEGEISTEDEKVESKKSDDIENKEQKPRAARQAYVHKPFLYSRYYSDSDDEVTVEQRRRSVAKDKEDRLLKRQQNRERLEEKRRQKADEGKAGKSSPGLEAQGATGKEARKEKKVLEKKVALSRRMKRRSRREDEPGSKKKGEVEEKSSKKSDEATKSNPSKAVSVKPAKKVSEPAVPEDTNKKKGSGPSEESPTGAASESRCRKVLDKGRTHSFILDLEQGSEELLRQRTPGKFDRHPRREQVDGFRHQREKGDKEKHKPKTDKASIDPQTEEGLQKDAAQTVKQTLDEKAEKKGKNKSDKKILGSRETRVSVSEGGSLDEVSQKENKKARLSSSSDANKPPKHKGESLALVKTESKLLSSQDLSGSSEDRPDLEHGCDSNKKKDKNPKENLKRSKSNIEERNIDKAKSKELKTGEKDSDRKLKGDLGTPKSEKSSSDQDIGRKSKETEAGVKFRSKSKDESKLHVANKTDKRAGVEGKSKGAKILVSKVEMIKEKRKDTCMKEERKDIGETSIERVKDAKKTTEKKAKNSEKMERTLSERKEEPKEEEIISNALPPPISETLMPSLTKTELEDSSNAHTSILDDALSDITPEPEDNDIAMEIDEDQSSSTADTETPQPSYFQVRNAPFVSRDVTHVQSGTENLEVQHQEELPSLPQEVSSQVPSTSFSLTEGRMRGMTSLQAAEMQEAALTLLSMDPESMVSHPLFSTQSTLHPPVEITSSSGPEPSSVTSKEEYDKPTHTTSSAEDSQEGDGDQPVCKDSPAEEAEAMQEEVFFQNKEDIVAVRDEAATTNEEEASVEAKVDNEHPAENHDRASFNHGSDERSEAPQVTNVEMADKPVAVAEQEGARQVRDEDSMCQHESGAVAAAESGAAAAAAESGAAAAESGAAAAESGAAAAAESLVQLESGAMSESGALTAAESVEVGSPQSFAAVESGAGAELGEHPESLVRSESAVTAAPGSVAAVEPTAAADLEVVRCLIDEGTTVDKCASTGEATAASSQTNGDAVVLEPTSTGMLTAEPALAAEKATFSEPPVTASVATTAEPKTAEMEASESDAADTLATLVPSEQDKIAEPVAARMSPAAEAIMTEVESEAPGDPMTAEESATAAGLLSAEAESNATEKNGNGASTEGQALPDSAEGVGSFQDKGEAKLEETPVGEETNQGSRTSEQQDEAPKSDHVKPPEEPRPARRGRPPKLVKQTTSASKPDVQEEEKASEPSDTEGRVTRKGRQSIQKLSPSKDAAEGLGEENESKQLGLEASAKNKTAEEAKETRGRRGRPPSAQQKEAVKAQRGENEEETMASSGTKTESDEESEKTSESRVTRRGRPSKTAQSPLRRSSSQELEAEDQEGTEAQSQQAAEKTPVVMRRGRSSGAAAKDVSKSSQQKKGDVEKAENDVEKLEEGMPVDDEKGSGRRGGRRGRVGRPLASKEQGTAESSDAKEINDTRRTAVKRKRSEDVEEQGEEAQADSELKGEGPKGKVSRDGGESQTDEQEAGKDQSSTDGKTGNDQDNEPPREKKVARRGRPPKVAAVAVEDSDKKDKKAAEKEGEQQQQDEEETEGEEDEETKTRATRSTTRLEAERSKPSKPSTRALSRLGGKEETSPSTRGGRGQGRKREASPHTPRTRGGQKLEEPPSKKAKR